MTDADKTRLEAVSALVDGELHGPDWAAAVESAVNDPQARAAWAVWHAQGDILRTGAAAPSRLGPDFASRVMACIAHDAPLRPAAAPAVLHRPASVAANDAWWKRAAGLASVALVAAAAWLSFVPGATDGGAALALQQTPPVAASVLQASAAGQPAQVVGEAVRGMSIAGSAAPQVMLRDPRLDEFLRSQRQAQGATAPFVRNANFDAQRR